MVSKFQTRYRFGCFLLAFAFIIFIVGSVGAVECNATSVADGGIINSSSISDGCTLDKAGTYTMSGETMYFNDSGNNGIIIYNQDNITIDCNNSIIIGNFTNFSQTDQPRLFYSVNRKNLILKNCIIKNYFIPVRLEKSDNFSIINNRFDFISYAYLKNNTFGGSFINNTFNNTESNAILDDVIGSANIGFYNNTFYNTSKSYGIRLIMTPINMTFEGNVFNYKGVSLENANGFVIKNHDFYNIKEDGSDTTKCFDILDSINGQIYDNRFININSKITGKLNNATNVSVYDNYIQNVTGDYDFWFEKSDGIYFYGNKVYNITGYGNNWKNSNGLFVYNNDFNTLDKLQFRNISNSKIYNNTIRYAITDRDGYDAGLVVEHKSQNISIYDNNITDIGNWGIVLRQVYNISVYDNNIDTLSRSQTELFPALETWGDIRGVGIGITELYISWVGDGSNVETDNYDNKMSAYNSTDISIYNNTYGDSVEVYFLNRGGISNIINEDIEGLDTWFRSYRFFYWEDKTDLWVNRAFNNLSTTQHLGLGIIDYVLHQNFRNINRYNYTITKDYMWFKNVNNSNQNLTGIYNLTSSLIYNTSNYATQGSGNINITLQPNEYVYVLDNYNVTEGVSRQYSPIWFSSSTLTEKHIASNLSDTITTTLVMNVDNCKNIGNIKQVSPSGYTITYQRGLFGSYTCSDNQVTIRDVLIEPSVESNEFFISYSCDAFTRLGGSLIIIFTALAVISLMLVFIRLKGGISMLEYKDLLMMFMIAILGVIFYMIIAQTIGGNCPVT